MMRDFVRKVCTGCSALIGTRHTSYFKRLNTILADAQLRGKDMERYSIHVSEDGYVLHADEAISREKRGNQSSFQKDADDDNIEVVPPLSNPLSIAP